MRNFVALRTPPQQAWPLTELLFMAQHEELRHQITWLGIVAALIAERRAT